MGGLLPRMEPTSRLVTTLSLKAVFSTWAVVVILVTVKILGVCRFIQQRIK